MKNAGLTSVTSRFIFVPLNQYGCPKIEPKCFQQDLEKDPRSGWEMHFKPI